MTYTPHLSQKIGLTLVSLGRHDLRLPELPRSFCYHDLGVTPTFVRAALLLNLHINGIQFSFCLNDSSEPSSFSSPPLLFLSLWPLWATAHLSSAGRLFQGWWWRIYLALTMFCLVVLIVLFWFSFSCGVKSQIVFSFHYLKTLGVS